MTLPGDGGGPQPGGLPPDYDFPLSSDETVPDASMPETHAPPRVHGSVPPPKPWWQGPFGWLIVCFGVIAVLSIVALGAHLIRTRHARTEAQGPLPEVLGPAEQGQASVVIISVPEGAIVRLDGEARGKTPLSLQDVAPGTRQLEVVAEGWLTWRGEVEAVAGQLVTVRAALEEDPFANAKGTGELSLITRPPAEVYVGGQLVGRTPLKRQQLPAGTVPLELVVPDGTHHHRAVFVPADRHHETFIDLTTGARTDGK